MSAAYSAKGGSFEAQKPRLWKDVQLAGIGQTANYDVSADGKRVIAIMESGSAAEPDRNVTFLFQFFR
jgi:hypothetical protein